MFERDHHGTFHHLPGKRWIRHVAKSAGLHNIRALNTLIQVDTR